MSLLTALRYPIGGAKSTRCRHDFRYLCRAVALQNEEGRGGVRLSRTPPRAR